MRIFRVALYTALACTLMGCMKKDVQRLENQVQLLDKRVELFQREQKKANAEIMGSWDRMRGELDKEIVAMQRSVAESKTRVDELIREMRTLSGKIEETSLHYQRLTERLAVTGQFGGAQRGALLGGTSAEGRTERPGGTSPAGIGTAPFIDPEITYKNAYTDYTQGNFQLAIINFETYVRDYPSAGNAVLAQYFIGESFYALGEFAKAIAAFDKVLANWPNDERAPVAFLKKGYALLSMGKNTEGTAVLQELIRRYPRTHEANLAKDRLASL